MGTDDVAAAVAADREMNPDCDSLTPSERELLPPASAAAAAATPQARGAEKAFSSRLPGMESPATTSR
jgi:hypothetical protein